MMKGVLIGVLQRRPEHKGERCHRIGASTETDDFEAPRVVILKRAGHLVEEVGQLGREVMREVGEAEALEGLGRCTADFRVVYKTITLCRRWHRSLPRIPIGCPAK